MDEDLEARLESHAQAFEGLLSLIPAKEYYQQDNSDQWQRKKQTKEEKRAAKMAKLDPANQKTAKDVMDENERKRKRELGADSVDDGPHVNGQSKKPKTEKPEMTEEQRAAHVEKRKEKRQRQKERNEKKREKAQAKKNDKKEPSHTEAGTSQSKSEPKQQSQSKQKQKQKSNIKEQPAKSQAQPTKSAKTTERPREASPVEDDDEDGKDDIEEDDDNEEDGPARADDLDAMDISGLADGDWEDASNSSVPTTPGVDSPAFDVSANHSTASSSSSILPPTEAPEPANASKKPAPLNTNTLKPRKDKTLNLKAAESQEFQSRLRARIEELRAKRKADGPDGQPARSRQELLESRRKKTEARKAHKKEVRRKAKEEEERINNERLHGSGSPLSADPFSPGSPAAQDNYFSFGRVAFDDGAQADPTLANAQTYKKKGPSDPKTALESAKKKSARLSGLDEEKRTDIQEKDAWLNAKKRAHGERVRDDQSLLKKALKRKEKAKSKSEKEWKERLEGVKKGQEQKQRKREENLAKRKEEKGAKGKGKNKGAKGGSGKKKGRPGFEGRFKA